ncbi:MAG: DUF2950 family protein [Aestuariivirga sp.]|uniref:DUF2950 family protein n=1 Tax=Aestuariivirga sp. TaxID=2650926 RepID=UPI0038CF8C89
MITRQLLAAILLGAALISAPAVTGAPALAMSKELESFIGAEPASFDSPEAAVAAFKNAMAKNDLAAVALLLGLDPVKVEKAENAAGNLAQMRAAAAEGVAVEDGDGQRVLSLGRQLWPFPFPIVRGADGKWAFDTIAGLEEIVNRRIGENELHAIETMRLYVEAQKVYAGEDHDADGVMEFAQKLVSGEGQTDGLYWPATQGDGDSPAGAIDQAALGKAKAGDGYFGYKFRILKRQGSNVAGGKYDYVINDNMIGGFALIAWPARYAETGVSTFMVNQAGIVYEKDFGVDTENIVSRIKTFNPGAAWQVVED